MSRTTRRGLFETLESRQLLATLQTGDLIAEIALREDQVLAENSNTYVPPSSVQLTDFRALADALLAQDIPLADSLAAGLDYELVEFTDTNTDHVYYLLREELVNGSPTRGWGTYIIDPTFAADVLVEAPHPIHDLRAEDVGIRAFLAASARGFLLAGAHRSANGFNTADVAHLENSIFQQVHLAWSGVGGDTQAWQMHGFDFDGHDDEFPVGTDVVLSNGDGGVSPEVMDLDSRFDAHAYDSYAYNTLAVDDPLNTSVNGAEPGVSFSSLGGTSNVQGIYTRSQGGRFVHVEMEQDIRGSEATRIDLAQQVAAALTATNTFFVTHSQFDQAGNDRTLTVDFSLPIDETSVAAGDLVIDGQAATAAQIIDADTVRFTLPVMSVSAHQAVLGQGSLQSASGRNLRAYDTTLVFVAPAPTVAMSFQEGLSGYSGTFDTYLDEASPSSSRATNSSVWFDGESAPGTADERQGLLRFDNLFGNAIGQIPTGATIVSAQLHLNVTDAGNAMKLHRMLQTWNETTTWNLMADGIQTNGVEAAVSAELITGNIVIGELVLDVFNSVTSWQANPGSNFGWALLPTGSNGAKFDSSEGATQSARPKLTITYISTNDSNPVAVDDVANTNEDSPLAIDVLANDSDADGDVLAVTTVSGAQIGTASIAPNGTINYTPHANVSGVDTLTYSLSDNQGGWATGTVTITVNAVNDAPTAANDAANTTGVTPIVINLLANDADIENNPLTASLVGQPTHGSVVVNPNGTATYTAAGGFVGADAFTYRVNDGQSDSNVATVTVSVAAMPKFFVVDSSADKSFRYSSNGAYLAQAPLNASNSNARGIAANMDGTRLWVLDSSRVIYVYDANQLLLGSWIAEGPTTATGVTISGNDLWISDSGSDRVYFYAGGANRLNGSAAATSSFALANGNGGAADLVTDGTTIWVTQSSATDKVFVYSVVGQFLGSWTLPVANTSPVGITLDPTGGSQHLWIVDSTTDQIFEYANARSRTSGTQAAAASYLLNASNGSAQGIADPRVLGAVQAAPAANAFHPFMAIVEHAAFDWDQQQPGQVASLPVRLPLAALGLNGGAYELQSLLAQENSSRSSLPNSSKKRNLPATGPAAASGFRSDGDQWQPSDPIDESLAAHDSLFASDDFLSDLTGSNAP